MTKRCWNCGEYHQNSASYCRFCGASLGNKNVFVQGVKGIYDFVDDKTHLSRRQLAAAAVIVVVIAAVAAVVLSDSSREEDPILTADITYNYKLYFENPLPSNKEDEPFFYPGEGSQFAVMKLVFVNKTKDGYISNSVDDWRSTLSGDNTVYLMQSVTEYYANWQPPHEVGPGESGVLYEVFLVPDSFTLDDLKVNVRHDGSNYKLALDPSIEV